MKKEELEQLFFRECTHVNAMGQQEVCLSLTELLGWITTRFCGPDENTHESLFKSAFTGMYDKKGKAIHEGSSVRVYYKGEYSICKVIYDPKHAAFFIKWPDGYVNQYFMNGANYEVVEEN